MCYSAQIQADYNKYVRLYGADISITEFYEIYWLRDKNGRVKTVKGMDAAVKADPATSPELRALLAAYEGRELGKLEEDLFKQRERLEKAEQALAKKVTKAATENRRIATNKIAAALERIEELRRDQPEPSDARVYPRMYAPVMIWEEGRRVIKPMRFMCRPANRPAEYDDQYPGTYNARRDNLERFWKSEFGHTHGVVLATKLYDYADVATPEGMKRVALEFTPDTGEELFLACIYSRNKVPNEPDLWSFAFITDDPPAEVLAAGHDRFIIPIRAENVDAWLRPYPMRLQALYDILDDRERPFYRHREESAVQGD